MQLEESGQSTNPRRYWSHIRELSGNWSSALPKISLDFVGKTHSALKSIYKAFIRQFTTVVEHQQDPSMRRLMRISSPPTEWIPSIGY